MSRDGDWTGWCLFFLTALTEQARENHGKAEAILNLYQTEKDRIIELTHSQHAIRALDFLFKYPIFTASNFVSETRISSTTVKRMLAAFHENGLLKELRPAEGRKPAVMAFGALLNIAEGAKVF